MYKRIGLTFFLLSTSYLYLTQSGFTLQVEVQKKLPEQTQQGE